MAVRGKRQMYGTLPTGKIKIITVRVSLSGKGPGPGDEEELEGKAEDGEPGVWVVVAGVVDSHLNVGGEDGDQQKDDEPGGEVAGRRREQEEGEGDFTATACIDEG